MWFSSFTNIVHFLFTNQKSKERNHSVQAILSCWSFYFVFSWRASSQVTMLQMIEWLVDCGDERMIFPVQSATTSWPQPPLPIWTWPTTPFWTSEWLWRWWRHTRSRTPLSPRTWRGSLPSWRSWTTPAPSPCKRSSLSSTSTDVWSSTLSLGDNLCDWKREDRALRAARGDEQVVLQLWSSFLWQW